MGTRDEEAERAAIEMLTYMKKVAAKVAWNHADIDDVAQEGALRILLHFQGFRGGSLRGWTGAIATNLTIHLNREYKRGVLSINAIGGDICDRRDPELDQAETDQRIAIILRLLAHLTAMQRQALQCRYLEGLSTRDVAARMGRSEGNVRALIHRALLRLRTFLRRRDII